MLSAAAAAVVATASLVIVLAGATVADNSDDDDDGEEKMKPVGGVCHWQSRFTCALASLTRRASAASSRASGFAKTVESLWTKKANSSLTKSLSDCGGGGVVRVKESSVNDAVDEQGYHLVATTRVRATHSPWRRRRAK